MNSSRYETVRRLIWIQEKGGATIKEIASNFHVEHQVAYEWVERLVRYDVLVNSTPERQRCCVWAVNRKVRL